MNTSSKNPLQALELLASQKLAATGFAVFFNLKRAYVQKILIMNLVHMKLLGRAIAQIEINNRVLTYTSNGCKLRFFACPEHR